MGLFTRQQHDGRLHYILKIAFERIKNDMHNLFHWVNYFHRKHQEHDERFNKIELHLSRSLPQQHISREEIQQMIELRSPHSRIQAKIDELHARIDKIESQRPERRIALKERLLKKITRNSKEYIKSIILATLKKYGRIQGPQLKEILVEEQGICSKSTFYRLLGEIEQEDQIASFSDGKEKTYFLKTQILK